MSHVPQTGRGHNRHKRFVPQTENDKEGKRESECGRKNSPTSSAKYDPLSLSFLAPSFAHKRRLDGGQKMKTRAGRNNDAAAVCVNIANTTRRACRLPRSTLVCCTSVLPSFLRGRRPRPSVACNGGSNLGTVRLDCLPPSVRVRRNPSLGL